MCWLVKFYTPFISRYAVLAGWKLVDFLWKWFCFTALMTLFRLRRVSWFCLIRLTDKESELCELVKLVLCIVAICLSCLLNRLGFWTENKFVTLIVFYRFNSFFPYSGESESFEASRWICFTSFVVFRNEWFWLVPWFLTFFQSAAPYVTPPLIFDLMLSLTLSWPLRLFSE